jgi:cytidyltransferase-like protein
LRIIDPLQANPASVVIMPGAFNPPTRAHVTLARTALSHGDGVLFALPSHFPHKEFTEATLDQRVAMLQRITASDPRLGTVVADGGLYVDIAREARDHFPRAEVKLVCGRDAAERIVGWTYNEPGVVERMLADFELLVASRKGDYSPPPHLRSRITRLNTPNLDDCSSSRLREMVARGADWRSLVPDEIVDLVERIYRR